MHTFAIIAGLVLVFAVIIIVAMSAVDAAIDSLFDGFGE